MQTTLTAIDIETPLISYTNPLPEVICMSAANNKGEGVRLADEKLGDEIIESLNEGNSLVGHNISFDLSLLCLQYPQMWPVVFKALNNGQIYDTLLRERLLMLTINGDFNVQWDGPRASRIPGYRLCDLEKKYLGIDRSELKTDPDSPRFNFASLKGVPVDKWDKETYDYSLDDSVNCLGVYHAQEVARQNCISDTGYDPFVVQVFRMRVAFGLRLLEVKGERVDPKRIKRVTDYYESTYNAPELVDPLTQAGLLIPGRPPVPYARGTKEHKKTCIHCKEHKDYKVGRKQTCKCPPKMKGPTDDKMPTKALHAYIWSLAFQDFGIEAWPAPKCPVDPKTVVDGKFTQEYINSTNDILPAKLSLSTAEEWTTMFADKDPLLDKWAQRKSLRKLVTEYLPSLHCEDGTPAEILRCSFFPLKKTGRSSSKAPVFDKVLTYPGRNAQNVHPLIRPCTIPRDGNILISTDINGMELATLAQKCITLFGKSILADKINAGVDTHAYLASNMALALDDAFKAMLICKGYDIADPNCVFDAFSKCKKSDLKCGLPHSAGNIITQYNAEHDDKHDDIVTWGEFFKFYRRFAKPVGLGFPGGLGPPTMVIFAKGTYKTEMTVEIARQLREVWLQTYPEMEQYLLYVKNHCIDKNHKAHYDKVDGKKHLRKYFYYDTPLGMHRARCGFCDCANGMGLQAPSAEGALDGLYRVQERMWLAPKNDVMFGCYPINFVHDEIIWECPDDDYVNARVSIVDKIMVDSMEKITPDVIAGTESVAMRRWYKQAEPVFNEAGLLVPWEPEMLFNVTKEEAKAIQNTLEFKYDEKT